MQDEPRATFPAPRRDGDGASPAALSPALATGLARLATVATDRTVGPEALITDILTLLGDCLDVGLLHLTRLEGDMLHYDRVYDRAGMGLPQGLAVPLAQTYCATLLAGGGDALVIEDARTDARVADKAATRLLGIGAYCGVTLYHTDGRCYGTLCALHPASRRAAPGEVALLHLAGRIIVGAVEALTRADEARRAGAAHARLVAELAPDAVISVDSTGAITSWNGGAARLFGYGVDEALGHPLTLLMPARFQAAHQDGLLRATTTGTLAGADHARALTGRRKDGGEFPMELSLTTWASDGARSYGAIIRDVSARARAAEELRRSEARFRALTEHASDLVAVLDRDGVFRYASPSHARVLGRPAADLVGTPAVDLLHPRDVRRFRTETAAIVAWAGAVTATRCRLRHADGTWRTLEMALVNQLDDPAVGGFIVNSRDVTERAHLEGQLRHQATHDLLTGLPNRALLDARAHKAAGRARREGRPAALLLLGLDRFKEVNDAFGRARGDALLCEVATRLARVVRAGDTVARVGGDEFAALLRGADAAGAERVGRDLRAALAEPLRVEGQALGLGASVGIALAPDHGADGLALLRHADAALQAAKRGRLGCTVYDPTRDDGSPTRLAVVEDLRAAIATGGLALHYQPQVDVASGRVCGVEALARWPHPVRGLVPPAQFIPLAEQTGLIAPLTAWALAEAVRQCRAWRRAGLLLAVSVNLSMWDLHDSALPDRVAALLRAHDVPPAWLRLELTESALMADTARTMEVLTRLAGLGVGLAVDDFGAGYSSLAYLKKLPVDELKIDQGFVRALATDATDAAIVASTVGLGHALGLRVVAEGIENEGTWDMLAGMGCDVAQGYYLSRPLPAAALARWLRDSAWAVA